MKKIRKAVIPAAGYGTRFLPITKRVPKELLPIGNKPAIQYVVEEAVAVGVEEIILVCHPSKLPIVDYFKPDQDLNSFLEKKGKVEELAELKKIESLAQFHVVYQNKALGLGHAIGCARPHIGDESFLVLLPDVLVVNGANILKKLVDLYPQDSCGLLLEKVPIEKVSSYGVVSGKAVGEYQFSLTGAIEKPKIGDAPSDLAILGRYIFSEKIFRFIDSVKPGALEEIQLTDAIDLLIKEAGGVGLVNSGSIFDVGNPEGLRKAYQYYEETLP